jgi:hypothetical protein
VVWSLLVEKRQSEPLRIEPNSNLARIQALSVRVVGVCEWHEKQTDRVGYTLRVSHNCRGASFRETVQPLEQEPT